VNRAPAHAQAMALLESPSSRRCLSTTRVFHPYTAPSL
jgi:hypothetical protein